MRHAATPLLTGSNLRAGLTRLARNALTTVWRPRNGWSPPPVLAVLRPTDTCNLRCRMCFDKSDEVVSSSWPAGPAEPELTEELWRSLINELTRFRCSFYITGGEPLLARTTLPIIAAIKAAGGYVSLNTNGVMLRACAQDLVGSGLDKIIVSLDGPRGIHEAIRGPSWEALAAGVAEVLDLKRRQRLTVPAVRAQCVISPHNVNALYDTAEAARALGFPEIRFQHLMFTSSASACQVPEALRDMAVRVRISALALPDGALDVAVLKAQIAALQRRRPGLIVRFEPPLRTADLGAYYDHGTRGLHRDCLGPWRRVVVSPQGELGPCQGLYLGRYPQQNAADIWDGPSFRAFRRRLLEQGLFPFCERCCHREYYPPRIGLGVS